MSRKHSAATKAAPNFFRVAVAGATVDGRTIQPEWLTQAAENFDPKVYGARIWVEHLKSSFADSPFSAQGDVVALKAEKIKDGALAGKMALYAAFDPLKELIELNKRGKKIYTSIEIEPKFADTGEAYVTGIAVTDNPASLGTEVLKFNAKANPQKFSSEYHETTLDFSKADPDDDDEDDDADEIRAERQENRSLFQRLMKRFNRADGDSAQAAKVIEHMASTIEGLQDQVEDLENAAAKHRKDYSKLVKRLDKLETAETDHQAFRTKLEGEEGDGKQRPDATGHNDDAADC